MGLVQYLAPTGSEAAQDVTRQFLAALTTTTPDPNTGKRITAQSADDRLQAVMAGQAAAGLHPECPDRQVQLVMHHHDPGGVVDPMASHQAADRLAGLVHECLRECQRHPLATDTDLAGQGQLPGPPERATVPVGEHCHDIGAEVVERSHIFIAGIAQADNQPGRRFTGSLG